MDGCFLVYLDAFYVFADVFRGVLATNPLSVFLQVLPASQAAPAGAPVAALGAPAGAPVAALAATHAILKVLLSDLKAGASSLRGSSVPFGFPPLLPC